VVDGRVPLRDDPGLGVEIDTDVLERFAWRA
jgi:L-alanine-DL-glutamate epimerase-like enolase superfamily enzyme